MRGKWPRRGRRSLRSSPSTATSSKGPSGVAYLGHFAENDEFVNSEVELQAATDRGEAHVYPGTKHWFMEDDRPEYDAAATELAYTRTVEFLRQHLA